MLRPELLDELVVSPEDFGTAKHRTLWQAMRALAECGEPVDLRTLQAELEARRALESVGGLAYLAAL